MPQQTTSGIEVTQDEERYLRRAFRRFAVPYLVGFAAIASIAIAVSGDGGNDASDSRELLEQMGLRLASVEQSLAALEGRVDAVGSASARTGQRVAALEKRPAAKSSGDLGGLKRELRSARKQVEQLEARLKEQAVPERIDALASRMSRIEADLKGRAPASRAPQGSAPATPQP